MKQKYLAMGITFLILIAITPLIFSKLMNAKLNKMIEKLNKEGYKIELVKDKSSYLKTDKVFLVEIPGEKLNSKAIDKLKLQIETIFNNLPATKVDFKGVLKKIILKEKYYENDINALLDNKIKFFATTPNFRIYTYRLKDINIPLNSMNLDIKGIKGIFEYSNVKTNKLDIKDIAFKGPFLTAEIKNLKNISYYKNKEIETKNRFDFYMFAQNNQIQINNINFSTKTHIDKKTDVISKISFDKLASNLLNVDNFVFNINLLKLDTPTLIAIANAKNPVVADNLSMELLKKGLEIHLYSKAKNVEFLKNKLGYYLVDAKVKILPDENLEEDLNSNNLKFLESHIHFESTPQMAALLVNLFPQSAFIFTIAKKENGKVIVDFSIKQSKIFVDGRAIN